MEEKILIRGGGRPKGKRFRYLWPAGCLWAVTLLYGGLLYGMNVNQCRYAWTEDSCFLKWEYSFLEFFRRSLGPDTFFVSLTLLLWCAVLFLLAGLGLYFAFGSNEITVSNGHICGRAAFGRRVQLPICSVLNAEEGMGHAVKLSLFSGSLLFGGMQNSREICEILDERLVAREMQNKRRVQIGTRGLSGCRLAVLCLLPFALSFLPILLWGRPTLGEAWKSYWGWGEMRERFGFLAYWLADQMSRRGSWPISLLYIAFPALLAGGLSFYACSGQKILITDSRVQGRASFRAAFDLPLSEIREAKRGYFGSVVLVHGYGKLRIHGIRDREEVLRILQRSVQQPGEDAGTSEPLRTELPEAGTISAAGLAMLCFLPLLLFVILVGAGIYRNSEACREIYQSSAAIRERYAYLEYLLIGVLSGNPGRWIKGFFWLSLVGGCVFPAYRRPRLRIQNRRLLGRSRWGGALDIHVDSVQAVSAGPLGTLTIYTDSGKFVFGFMENRNAYFDYFAEKFKKDVPGS